MEDSLLARDYITEDFHSLRLLRLFLPTHDRLDEPQRWSEILPAGVELAGSTDWNELWSAHSLEHADAELPRAPLGTLDLSTAQALGEILIAHFGPRYPLHTRSWVGRARAFPPDATSSSFDGHEFVHEILGIEEVIASAMRDQVPEFVEDPFKTFAWGTCLYPDSLIIAAEPVLFRALHQDPRLEAVSIMSHRDILPAPFEG